MRSRGDKRREFERFAETESAGLYKLAFSLCGQRERAEDAVQEAFAEVYRRWTGLREPLAYARRVTVNATHNGWRSNSRQDRISRTLMQEAGPETVVPQDLVPERDALVGALDQLPHRLRTVVVLRYVSQLTEAETAAVLELPLGTVKTHARRALAQMREALSGPTPSPCTESHR
jgi:RNA polymerase sigma-70 factor (sigma-E family)